LLLHVGERGDPALWAVENQQKFIPNGAALT